MEGISLLDLPLANIAEVEAGQFAYIVTPDGVPFRVDISDLVGKMQTDNGGVRLYSYTEIIPSADILTGNTTPVTLNIPRSSGESIGIVGTPVFSLSYGTATYATNTTAAIRYVGADIDMFTCDILGRTASGAKIGVPVTTVSASQSQVLENIDLEWYVKTGDPITGDGTTTVTVVYYKQV